MPTFYDPVDFTKAETRNLVSQKLASAPAAPIQGQKYYDTTLLREGVYSGTAWDYFLADDRPVGSLGSGVLLRGYEPLVTVAASKTLALSDACTVQVCTAVCTITIPLNATVPYAIGTHIRLRRSTSATVTIALTAGVTVNNELGTANTLTTVSNFTLLRKIGTDTWVAVNPIHNNANLPGTPTLATQALGNVSLNAANTTCVARSCRPIVIASRTTAFTLTTTYADLAFNNVIRDSSAAYNATTGVFTAPYAGIYSFGCFVANYTGGTTFTLVGVGTIANTESLRLGLVAGTGFQVVSGNQRIFMAASATRRFGVQTGGANAAGSVEANATAQTACYISIEYLGIDT